MDKYTAFELSYKNGFDAGRLNTEIATRVKVAYEQLAKCHTDICKTANYNNSLVRMEGDFREVLNMLLELQVELGVLKHEENM